MEDTAKALDDKNPSAFLANFDLSAYANNYLKNFTNNTGLSSLNPIGEMFGLGSVDSIIKDFVNMQGKLKDDFITGVSSGEIILQCKKSEKPDCPWVPESLRKAKVVQLDDNAAIAQVTTPMNLASWLALRKINGRWLIVGQSILENDASSMAQTVNTPATQPQKQPASPNRAKNPVQHSI